MYVRLFNYWRSSSAYRVRIALHYKSVNFEYIPVNLLESAQANASYLAHSPMGHVPCLEIDGETFVETVALFDLLEALVPAPALYPSDPFQRARVLALVETINSGTQPLQNLIVLNRLAAEHRRAWAHDFIARGLRAYEALVAPTQGRFSCGDTFTAADAFLVPQLYNARRFEVDMAAFPRIARIEAAALELGCVAAAHPDVQPDAPVASVVP
jgi:maleylpyruvate isomerase